MRKILPVLALLLALAPITADAAAVRSHSTRAFLQSQNSTVRTRWQRARSTNPWRYFPTYSRYDLLRWRNETSVTEADPVVVEEPAYLSSIFCSYENSRIGQYLSQSEIDNRCCVCDNGWKCEYSHLVSKNFDRVCSGD